MRVLVCGSRTFEDAQAIWNVLGGIHNAFSIQTIIQGGAKGADLAAFGWARANRVEQEAYAADWNAHGKAAGPIRNQQMLDEGKPDVVWAFVDKPLAESKGTADMVRRARKAGVPVYVVEAIR